MGGGGGFYCGPNEGRDNGVERVNKGLLHMIMTTNDINGKEEAFRK